MSVDEPVSPEVAGSVANTSATAGRLGIGIIGAGRVGAVLGNALRAAGHTITGVHAVSEESKTRAETLLPGAPILEIPEILRRSEMVLFAVPDDVLEDLVSGLAAAGHVQTGHLFVHTSGRHGLNVMASIREHGAIPLAIHPAMTFTGLSLDVERLVDCAFGVTADSVMLPIAQALVVEMGGEPVVITEQARPAYHAAMSHASNHLVTLTSQAKNILSAHGIEEPQKLLGALMTASLENALTNSDQALTGPIARGDAGTVANHLEKLRTMADIDPQLTEILDSYLAMARATVQRRHQQHNMSDGQFAEFQRILGGE